MAVQTYAEQLEQVQAAIRKVEAGGQDITLDGGKRLTRGDLATLYKREEQLRRLVARDEAGGIGVRYGVPS